MLKSGELASLESSQDVSLYFHIPFCSRKCPYCSFYVVSDLQIFKEPFLRALEREWEKRKALLSGKRIVSIYFGGGTPTKLAPAILAELLERIARDVTLDPSCEITLEANPEDITYEKMRAYLKAGINRVSIGVQSLVESELRMLNRQHGAHDALCAIDTTHKAGFSNISIDLMCELPTQTLCSWEESLKRLDTLPITHLSLYNLTFEPHTLFFKKRTELQSTIASEEDKLLMLQSAISRLQKIGLERYEISAFARPGKHARHNIGYWLARPFLGFGPSAFSYWEKKRFSNHAHLQRYIQTLEKEDALPLGFEESLLYPKNVLELFAVHLRLLEGIDLPSFQKKQGQLPQELAPILKNLQEQDLVHFTADHCALTAKGLLFYDTVASALV